MVDARAIRFAVLVAGSAFLLLLAGLVLRWTARFLAYATLALLVVLLAYATYELYAGWSAAASEERAGETTPSLEEGENPLESLQGEYASGPLSDEEFEAELEELMDSEADRESELEYESG